LRVEPRKAFLPVEGDRDEQARLSGRRATFGLMHSRRIDIGCIVPAWRIRVSHCAAAACLLLGLFGPLEIRAQASPDLEFGSRVEWAIEKLTGFGLIDDVMFRIRPRSHREALRLLAQARDNMPRLDAKDRKVAEEIFATISQARLNERLNVTVRGDATLLDSPWLPVPTETGADRIDAEVNRLVRYDGGRHYADGQTFATEVGIDAKASRYFALQARPRFWLARDSTDETSLDGKLMEGQVRFQYRKLRLDVGRHISVVGPGRNGGTLLANNARGFDEVRISNDAPFRLPGVLSYIGLIQAELFIARLEKNRDVPHSNFVAYTISIMPYKLVEASYTATIHSGGEGSPKATFGELIADHLVIVDWFLDTDFLFSNKATSFALSVRIPPLRNARVFGEFTVEDPSLSSWERMFWQECAWLFGVWVPRLDETGVFDLRAEFHHGGVRLHRHGQFTSGRTLDRRMFGMGGPDTYGAFIELAANKPKGRVAVELGVENRSADRWESVVRWVRVEDLPDEFSFRGIGSLSTVNPDGPEFGLRFGFEQVFDSRFVSGKKRLNTLFQIQAVVPIRSLSI